MEADGDAGEGKKKAAGVCVIPEEKVRERKACGVVCCLIARG